MDFSGRVMGQSVLGRLSVEDRTVQVEMALPLASERGGGGLEAADRQQGRKLLDGP